MRIFKIKPFDEWMAEVGITDSCLVTAASELSNNLYEANLGGNIYKKRVPLNNQGKRGGARTIVAFKTNDKSIFLYGYAKNKKSNITDKEEKALKKLAKFYFEFNNDQIKQVIKSGELIEVKS